MNVVSEPVPIAGGDRYEAVATVIAAPGQITHGHVLAVSIVERVVESGRQHWDGHKNVFTPPTVEKQLVYTLGITHDVEIESLRQQLADAQRASDGWRKESRENAQRAEELLKEKRNLETDFSRLGTSNHKLEQEVMQLRAAALKLETDLAKARKFFGEKAFADATT